MKCGPRVLCAHNDDIAQSAFVDFPNLIRSYIVTIAMCVTICSLVLTHMPAIVHIFDTDRKVVKRSELLGRMCYFGIDNAINIQLSACVCVCVGVCVCVCVLMFKCRLMMSVRRTRYGD